MAKSVSVIKIDGLKYSVDTAKKYFPNAEVNRREFSPKGVTTNQEFNLYLSNGIKITLSNGTGYIVDGYPDETPSAGWWRRIMIPRLKGMGVEINI